MTFTFLFWSCILALAFLAWVQYNNDKTLKQILKVLASLLQDRLANNLTETHLQELMSIMDTPGMYNRHMWRLVFFRNPKWLYPKEIYKRFE